MGLDVRVSWRRSKHDRCPQGLEDTPVEGRWVVVSVKHNSRWLTLLHFTTLLDEKKYTPQALAELDGQRWKVCFRYLKSQMDLGVSRLLLGRDGTQGVVRRIGCLQHDPLLHGGGGRPSRGARAGPFV